VLALLGVLKLTQEALSWTVSVVFRRSRMAIATFSGSLFYNLSNLRTVINLIFPFVLV
jgi:hypothetical protein